MGEWEAPAILTQIIKNSIAEDITSFLVVLACAMVACGVAASALNSHINCERNIHDCYLEQDEWGEWSSMHYVAAQFIWPVVGVATDELGFEAADAGKRGARGAIMMLTFGTLVLLVMLNLLIA